MVDDTLLEIVTAFQFWEMSHFGYITRRHIVRGADCILILVKRCFDDIVLWVIIGCE
ncbi:MAG: hypothetical protein HDR00_14250 [Lachnospiraceae bacterium]|nr:hypothetical protein [Lachnospiraceae bacterium]